MTNDFYITKQEFRDYVDEKRNPTARELFAVILAMLILNG